MRITSDRLREQILSASRQFRDGAPSFVQFVRRSLLMQLLCVYLVFVLIVLATGIEADRVGQGQLVAEIQTTDVALAQEVAFDTNTRLSNIEHSLTALSELPTIRDGVTDDMLEAFSAFRVSRSDIDQVYWLDATGVMRASEPVNLRTLGASFSTQPLFQRALSANGVIVQAGIVDLTTFNADINFTLPVRNVSGQLLGVLGAGVLLDGLNAPIQAVMNAQAAQHETLRISILDHAGNLIASPDRERLLQPGVDQLPGAAAALHGAVSTQEAQGPRGQQWLYSAAPIKSVGWAVVVQRPASDLSAAVSNFRDWLGIASALFALGGLLFWLILVWRVVRPLHDLTSANTALADMAAGPNRPFAPPPRAVSLRALTPRADEIGSVARTLVRLQRDVATQLTELRTLLDTSNAVVHSLDPQAVSKAIIREVRRLVDVQAAAVLAPDDQGKLRTLVSEGCEPESLAAPFTLAGEGANLALRALRDGEPIQMIADGNPAFPVRSYAQGFRCVLALPIVTERVGAVVLEAQRTQPTPFNETEVNLLMTFANYATLAWEHAVLYERSDERLREIAEENAKLYQQANAERQTLSAIMSSMTDGLLLASVDGSLLYVNPGMLALVGMSEEEAQTSNVASVHAALAATAERPERYRRELARAEAGDAQQWLLETKQDHGGRAYTVRSFDVRDEAGNALGQGLLARDVTRERDVDEFKSALLAAVGHELRTPLAAIKGHASTLLQDDVTWALDDQRHFLQTISSEADRLAQMVTNLLDLSRLEAGLLLIHRAPCFPADLIHEAARRIAPADSEIAIDVPDDLPLVDVDAPRIEVVLRNLLNNALAYGDGGVRIAARRDGDFVRVAVIDGGPGIADDDLPYIFERFYRASHGQRRSSNGSGLGLAICKAFVEAHGGRIWAETRASGAAIKFTLPLARPGGPSFTSAPSEPSGGWVRVHR
ncbi:MAG TPA: ATP-binding protein [Ktedonobacterales bacterium]|jgi:PAS domain S-box-containing protein|nr:ATP-binding protein [Ktedonobacterales bacterium]